MIDKLKKLAAKLTQKGLTKEADLTNKIAESLDCCAAKKSPEDKTKLEALKKRYMNDKGEFKGGSGAKFDNCVKYQLARDEAGIYGFKLKVNKKHTTKEDAAKALCGAIKRKKYGCLTQDDVRTLHSYVDLHPGLIVKEAELEASGLTKKAYGKGEEIPAASTHESLETFKEKNPKWNKWPKGELLKKWDDWGNKYKIKTEIQEAGKKSLLAS
jgi:hypothetical protein